MGVARLRSTHLLTNVASGGDAAGDTIQQFENVIGSIANDTLVGNNGANTIDGTAGGDTLAGAGGNDLLIGGRGADAMDGGTGIDTVSYTTSPLGVFVNLASNASDGDAGGDFIQNVENVIGSQFGDTLIGNASVNVLQGGGGHDFLGEGAGGADTMIGGTGDDAYIVTAVGTTVVEGAGEGDMDQVASNISIALAANVERLLLFGSANISGTGNSLANVIFGNTGHNILNGLVGADLMTGDIGNDTYFVDNAGDVVTENARRRHRHGAAEHQHQCRTRGQRRERGADRHGQYQLSAAMRWSTASPATAATISCSPALALTSCAGGLGDDIDGGQRHRRCGGRVCRPRPRHHFLIRTLYLAEQRRGPSAQLCAGLPRTATGNALANRITGTTSQETFDGKAGADTMIGDYGDDFYYVDNAGDVVTELRTKASTRS